jgi:hypothetical protein
VEKRAAPEGAERDSSDAASRAASKAPERAPSNEADGTASDETVPDAAASPGPQEDGQSSTLGTAEGSSTRASTEDAPPATADKGKARQAAPPHADPIDVDEIDDDVVIVNPKVTVSSFSFPLVISLLTTPEVHALS